jgi:hypothetical protein
MGHLQIGLCLAAAFVSAVCHQKPVEEQFSILSSDPDTQAQPVLATEDYPKAG